MNEQKPLEWALSIGEQYNHMQEAALDLAAQLNSLAKIITAEVFNDEDLGAPQEPSYYAIDWALFTLKREVIPEFEAVLKQKGTRAS